MPNTCVNYEKNAAAARCWRCPTVNSLPKTGPPAGAAGRVCPVKAVQGMAEPLHYRNKAIASFATQRGKLVCGLYAEGTHRVLPGADCLCRRKF